MTETIAGNVHLPFPLHTVILCIRTRTNGHGTITTRNSTVTTSTSTTLISCISAVYSGTGVDRWVACQTVAWHLKLAVYHPTTVGNSPPWDGLPSMTRYHRRPTENTETVDHRRARVPTDQRIRIEHLQLVIVLCGIAIVLLTGLGQHLKDDTCQVLQIDLVNDTWARWHDLKVLEGFAASLEELETFIVSLEFTLLTFTLSAPGVLFPGTSDQWRDRWQ